MDEFITVVVLLIGVALLGFAVARVVSQRTAVRERLRDETTDDVAERDHAHEMPTEGWIASWLYRAGFRSPSAEGVFWASTAGLALIGISLLIALWRRGIFLVAADFVGSLPGGVGNVMIPFVLATPWFVVAVITLIPLLIVRSVRRQRVRAVEHDLPLLLDLLNTLAQSGVGFDAALDRILGMQDARRPLVTEFRTFQYDNLAGRSRIESLRRLMHRVEIPMFSTFISSIVQAEQTGASISETLRNQATEMRSRRRERASAAAMSVPTLLVVPMVIGFLPGIFVILIGPMLYEAFGAMGQSLRGVTGQ